MKEIYWITRLDGVCDILGTIFGILLGISIMLFIAFIILSILYSIDELEARGIEFFNTIKKYLTWSVVSVVLTSIIRVFIPSTKEACAIYVGGSVIDYVQGNEQLREMPDKVVNFASEYLDQLIKKGQDENKKSSVH